jgi:hypothetical protein
VYLYLLGLVDVCAQVADVGELAQGHHCRRPPYSGADGDVELVLGCIAESNPVGKRKNSALKERI